MIRRAIVRLLLAAPDARRELLRHIEPTPQELAAQRVDFSKLLTRAAQDVLARPSSPRQGIPDA